MRILVVNNFFWPRTTGSSHFTEGIAERYVREGHEVGDTERSRPMPA